MVEPQQKRVKLPSSQDGDDESSSDKHSCVSFPRSQLEVIHGELRRKCLCPLQLPNILHTLSVCNDCFSSQEVKRLSELRAETLLYTSMLSLFFEVSLKQQSKGVVCARISEVVAAGADNEGAVVDILFGLLGLEDKYVSYSAGRAIAALLLMLRGPACQYVLEKLSENIAQSLNLLEVGHSIDVVKRIIEWKDLDEHPLDGHDPDSFLPRECMKITLSPADTQGANEVKYVATKKLESKWFILVTRLTQLVSEFSVDKEHVIVSFLSLWEALISVKANLSITDTKEFYSGLERLLNLLTRRTHPIIWRKVLDIYNEVLCYGSTLALQDILAEEPCNLAHLIIRAVKDRRFLECVPWSSSAVIGLSGNDLEGSSASSNLAVPCSSSQSTWDQFFLEENTTTMTSGHHDSTIMHKIVLLVLKAIAVTVKETRCDSSSENSSRSGGSGSEDMDMAIIERSLREVLKKLDAFVKSKLPFHPEAPMAEWMVRLFADQDDWLVESMVCGLDIYTGLGLRLRHHSELQACVNPHETFGVFVETLHLDHDVLLDLLVSNETCFLLYLLRYLKLLRKNWSLFVRQCLRHTQQVMTVLIRLRLAIDRLVSKNLFPYNITPVLRLLEKCEDLYENQME